MVLTLIFDGGYNQSVGAYGSYIIFRGDSVAASSLRESFPEIETSNQAEYKTLVEALRELTEIAPQGSTVSIFGDSKLVINQLNREWRVRNAKLKELLSICREHLVPYVWYAEWWPRVRSVEYLGH